MQKAKKIALIVGVIGLLICIPLFFLKDTVSPSNFFLSLAIIYTLIILIGTTILFLYSYFNDFKIHPEFKKEAKTMSIYFFGSLILGLILSFIFGGTDPIVAGDGSIYDSKGKLLLISTIIWTALIMILAAFVLSIKPLLAKKSKS